MPRMNLTTFLANDSSDSVTKASKMAKYADAPGGADYYWGLKHAARKIFLEGEPYDQAVSVMINMTVDHQRRDNQSALRELHSWKLANPGDPLEPPTGQIAGPAGELIIKLEPAFAIERNGKREAYVLWTYKDLRLTRAVAGMGILLLEQGLQVGEFADWQFYILDVVTKKRFGHSAIGKSTAMATVAAIQAQESLFLSAKGKKAA